MRIVYLLLILCFISSPVSAFWMSGGGSGGGGTPAGEDTQIQFNDNGAFAGHEGLSYNPTTAKLTVGYISAGEGYTGDLQNNGGGDWVKSRQLTVTALADALPAGYSVKVILTDATANSVFAGGQNAVRIATNIATAATTLDGAIDDVQTIITLTNTAALPDVGMVIVENERIGYSSKNTTQLLGCVRGSGGTTPAAHATGLAVTTVQELERHIETFTSTNVTIWFKLRRNILANENSMDYKLYYGNASAGAAPSNGKNVFDFFDDFSTDTSANYVFSGDIGTKVYDGVGHTLQQTTTSALQYNLVHNTYLVPNMYVYQAEVMLNNDAQNRNHGGLLSNWLTTDNIGYRATHLDNIFEIGEWSGGSAYDDAMTNVTDNGMYADGNWLTERIYRNSTTGLFRFWATNGALTTTVDNTDTSYIAGGIGLHSYGCQGNYRNLRVRLWVDTDTVDIDGNFAVADAEQVSGAIIGGIRTLGTPIYADNDTAIANGLIVGDNYRTPTGVKMEVY